MNNVPGGAANSPAVIEKKIGRKMTNAQEANATSVVVALDKYGKHAGLDQPHRHPDYRQGGSMRLPRLLAHRFRCRILRRRLRRC